MKYIIICGPSGVGKTTIVNAYINHYDNAIESVSHTTRTRRINEINNVHYNFISKTKFKEMIKNNEFIEHANVQGELYGTSRKTIEQSIKKYDTFSVLDIQGAIAMRKIYPDAISIFILPPTLNDLRARLRYRGDNFYTKNSINEIANACNFKHIIINDDIIKVIQKINYLKN